MMIISLEYVYLLVSILSLSSIGFNNRCSSSISHHQPIVNCKNHQISKINRRLAPLFQQTSPSSPSPSQSFVDRIQSLSIIPLQMFFISGPLGMSLDNYHGLFQVLSYNANGIPINLSDFHGHIFLRTAIWVPFLFGFAGSVMSFIGLYLDQQLVTVESIRQPTWSKTFYSISLFSFQYYISGLLDNLGIDVFFIHLVLAAMAIIGLVVFDGSMAGFALAMATSIAGPLAEIILINNFNLYSYQHADWLGICSWIPWVYFLGAPAVLNLARSLGSTQSTINGFKNSTEITKSL